VTITTIRVGHVVDELRAMPAESVHMACTSPPYYGLRDYRIPPQVWGGDPACPHTWAAPEPRAFCSRCAAWRGHLGLEPTLDLYLEHLVEIFDELRRVLRRDGTLWLNVGDSYASRPNGSIGKESRLQGEYTAHTEFRRAHALRSSSRPAGFKHKDRMMVPARLAIALQEAGWWHRDEIVWRKPNPMPMSATDRTTAAHEMIYVFAKSRRYFYDNVAILEPFADGRMGADYPKPNAPDKIKSPHGQGFSRANEKRPAGWASTPGGHGTIHPQGREQPDKDGLPRGWSDDGERGSVRRGTARPASERNRGGRTDGYTKPNDIDPSANGGRNKRSVWEISTSPYAEAHFAVWPAALVEPMILAGTSARGVCSICGAPWQRAGNGRLAHDWQPTCACGADVVPATVLDPFLGSGTTGLVAESLGRHCIGIELSGEYAAMARRRIDRAHPELRQQEGDARHSAAIGQPEPGPPDALPLFQLFDQEARDA
jgi:DNA modification methylase